MLTRSLTYPFDYDFVYLPDVENEHSFSRVIFSLLSEGLAYATTLPSVHAIIHLSSLPSVYPSARPSVPPSTGTENFLNSDFNTFSESGALKPTAWHAFRGETMKKAMRSIERKEERGIEEN